MDEKWICAKAKVKFLVIFFTLVEMRLIPAGRCVTMPVWFTVCKAGYYLEAPAAQILTPSIGGGELQQQAQSLLMPGKHHYAPSYSPSYRSNPG